jgi:FolB domain-containing protein
MTIKSGLILHELEIFVFLGAQLPERKHQQRISVDIHIEFVKPPTACTTDLLSDTFCYDSLNQTIQNHIMSKEFLLLEHLTYDIYACVKTFLSKDNKITIKVTKFPDIFLRSKGVSFWYGDDKQSTH